MRGPGAAGHPRRPARRPARRSAGHEVRVPAHLLPRRRRQAVLGATAGRVRRPRRRPGAVRVRRSARVRPVDSSARSAGPRATPHLTQHPGQDRHERGRAGRRLPRSPCPDFTPPPQGPPEQRTAPGGSRGPLALGTWRRAHWKPGVRIGIRDSDGRLVGPVYKDGAVEEVTFTRERRFFPRARIRPDLPLAPTTAVYKLSNSAAPQGR